MHGSITFATFEVEHTDPILAKRFQAAFGSGQLAQEFGLEWPEPSLPISQKGREEMSRLVKGLPEPNEIAPHVYGSIQRRGASKLFWMLVAPWPDPTPILDLCERAGFKGIGNWFTVVDYIWEKRPENASH